MKLAKFLTPQPPPSPSASFAAFGGALNKRKIYLSILSLIIVTLWNTHSVTAAPAKIDSLDSTFPLDLQPPIFEATAKASSPSLPNGDNHATTIDSYGNLIESLKPIETPDGRKVVSAQGLQFEIPNYASGITELKKPSDDLLPPFVGEFSNDFDKSTTTRTTNSIDDVGQSNDDKPGIRINNNDNQKAYGSLEQKNSFLTSDANLRDQQSESLLRIKRQLQYTTDTNNNNNNNYYNIDNFNAQQRHDVVFKPQITNNINVTNTTTTSTTNHKRQEHKLTTTTNTPLSNVANSLSFFVSNQSKNLNFNSPPINSSLTYSSSSSPRQFNNSFQSPSFKAKLSAHYTPLSNGNFNYPNLPTDKSIIDRIFSKYKNPLPTLDPIVVALPNAGTSSSDETTSVDVEHAPLVEVKSHDAELLNSKSTFFKVLPDYILEFNDPDIGGPVDYKPTQDKKGLSVIAWDLLPPLEVQEDSEKSISHSNKFSVTTGHNLTAEASSHTSHKETTTKPNYTQNRDESYYTTTTPRTTSTRRTKTTTTTPRTTTTLRTTTTPRTTTTTTRRTTTPRTTTTTTPEPDSSEFFKLEAGNSYTLPPWLQDIDDPELDVAVAYVVPEDINEYNHTISRDLLPPFEPYTDLNNVHLTPPPNYKEGTTTIRTTTTRKTTTPRTTAATTTTTTRRPSTTIQAHWIRVKPTSPKPTIATFNNQFTSLSPSISLSTFAQRTTSTTTATTTTTVKPKTTINFYNRQLSSNTPQTDKIGSSSEEQINKKQTNPFLPASFDDGKYKPYSTSRRTVTTTTTTTTTTTPAPVVVEENPFAPTIPPWLKDFDYPDLAPGVPFIYDPNEDEYPVDKNILPPSKTQEDSNKSNPSSTFPFSNSQTPQGFTNKFTSSSTPLASSSSIPSIVTIPLPSTQTNQDDSTFTRPPPVFAPPPPTSEGGIIITNKADDITIKTSTTFNKNFAAPFDPATATISTTTTSDGVQKKVPLSADSESFPPFNNIITGSSTIPSKTTFTKSEDGKVITNNVFTSGSLGSTSAQPIGSSSQEKNAFTTQSFPGSTLTKSTTASSVFKQFGTTSAGASGFVTSSGRPSSSDSSKYTGRFGGPPGVLAPQNTGFITSGTSVTKSYNKPALKTFEVSSSPGAGSNTNYKFTGSFGGPPGVLKPYDNIKNR